MLWLLAIPVAVLSYALFIERFWFAIRRDSVAVLPEGAKPITVLHISDLHMAPWQRRKQSWLRKLNQKVQPDLVINTGDNLGHKKGIKVVLSSLDSLKGNGVFVNGSNDLYAPVITNPFGYLFKPSERHRDNNPESILDVDALHQGFKALGWQDINNSATAITINGTKIVFLGTDDPHEARMNIAKTAKAAESLTGDIRIGVTHAPYLSALAEIRSLNVDMIFAGHTHGGQVCIPFTGQALVTNCTLPTKYARGLNQLELNGKKFWLSVCAGLGNSIYAPVRLACRPEVRVITLTAKN